MSEECSICGNESEYRVFKPNGKMVYRCKKHKEDKKFCNNCKFSTYSSGAMNRHTIHKHNSINTWSLTKREHKVKV